MMDAIPVLVVFVLVTMCIWYYKQYKHMADCLYTVFSILDDIGEFQHFQQVLHDRVLEEERKVQK